VPKGLPQLDSVCMCATWVGLHMDPGTLMRNETQSDSFEGDFREFWRHFLYNLMAMTMAIVFQVIYLRKEFRRTHGVLWPLYNSVRCLSSTTFLNYMVFMNICRNMFATLTIVSAFIMLMTGNFSLLYEGFVGVDDASLVHRALLRTGGAQAPMVTVWTIYLTTFLYGIVVLVYAQLMQSMWHQTPLFETSHNKMDRTIWLSWLPVRDQMRGAAFLLTDGEIQRVASDLRLALLTTLATPAELQGFEMLKRLELDELAQRLVETVEVSPVVDRHHELSFLLRDSEERADSYRACSVNAGKFLLWWYTSRLAYSKRQADFAREELLRLNMSKKSLSGSAFVTFHKADVIRKLMSMDPPRCWEMRGKYAGFSYFTFGRPPFASVTLKIMPAPHPDDLNWSNLHISWKTSTLRFCLLAGVLLVVMVGLITPENLQALFLPLLGHEFFAWFGRTEDVENNVLVMQRNLHQFKTTMLLGINSIILPELIYRIAVAARHKQKYVEEVRQMQLNFYFLVFNTVVLPILQKNSLKDMAVRAGALVGNLFSLEFGLFSTLIHDVCSGFLHSTRGRFAIQYLMSSSFLSNAIALMAMHWMWVLKRILLRIYAVSDRERQLAREPAVFAWGYWYAWLLSVVALGLSMSSIIPGILPVGFIFFTIKGLVDRYNLNRGIWILGSENKGIFTIHVVYYMRFIVAAWWMFMGCVVVTAAQEVEDGTVWPGVVLMTLSLVVFVSCLFRSAMMSSHLARRERGTEMLPTNDVFKRLGEMMRLSPQSTVRVRRSTVDRDQTHLPCTWDVMNNRDVIWPDSVVTQRLQETRNSRESILHSGLALQIHRNKMFSETSHLEVPPREVELSLRTAPCLEEGGDDVCLNMDVPSPDLDMQTAT